MDRRIVKFKHKPKENYVFIKYETDNEAYIDTVSIESHDEPHPDLPAALQAFALHVGDMAEFPEDYCDGIQVLGVTWTWSNGVRGCVVTARKELEQSNAPLIINTPNFTDEPYNEDDDSGMNLLNSNEIAALDRLEKEVFAFVDGKRAQGDLFADADPDFHQEKEGQMGEPMGLKSSLRLVRG
jgi:hypothetical protein